MYMAFARSAAMRSTCFRLNVGAVVVEDRNVIAIGYNGAPSGEPHCGGNGCVHYQPKGCGVVHAERNALDRAQFQHPPLAREIYVTHSPCAACAAMIHAARIARVYFEIEYRDRSPLEYLIENKVEVYRLLPSGLVIDVLTGSLFQP
jgi:dCMP deaminase